MAVPLCHIDDIPEGSARGFTAAERSVLVVKKRGDCFVYLNRCPHLGIALEWEPDNFLDSEGLYIRCCNHGAFFEIDTGLCIMGPCMGDSLWALDYHLEAGRLMLDEAALPESPSQA